MLTPKQRAEAEKAYQRMVAQDKGIESFSFFDLPALTGEMMGEWTSNKVNKTGLPVSVKAGLATGSRMLPETASTLGLTLAKIGQLAKDGYYSGVQEAKNRFGMGGSIAGVKAQQANLAKLTEAEELTKQGLGEDEIYQKTGWWLNHPDGKPRFEIDDTGYTMNETYIMPPKQRMLSDADKLKKEGKDQEAWALERQNRDLSDFGDYSIAPALFTQHKNLNDNYPETMWKMLTPNDELFTRGHNSKDGYGLSVFAENPKSTLLHEFQHDIQGREGFSRGGNLKSKDDYLYKLKQGLDTTSRDYYNLATEQINDVMDAQRLKKWAKISGGETGIKPSRVRNTQEWSQHGMWITGELGNMPKTNKGGKRDQWLKDASYWIYQREKDELSGRAKGLLQSSDDYLKDELKYLKSERKPWYGGYKKYLEQDSNIRSLDKLDSNEFYRRLAGESEARLTQDRLNLSQQERMQNPFYKNYDVPFKDMILK